MPHYDHLGRGETGSLAGTKGRGVVHPGADDNASGVAGLIVLARRLSGAPPLESTTAPAATRPFRQPADGDLRGLLRRGTRPAGLAATLSSIWAISELQNSQLDVKLNRDLIGRLRDRKLFVLGTETSRAWRPMIEAANHASPPVPPAFGGTGVGMARPRHER